MVCGGEKSWLSSRAIYRYLKDIRFSFWRKSPCDILSRQISKSRIRRVWCHFKAHCNILMVSDDGPYENVYGQYNDGL